jgi:hypothetical protein
MMPIVIFDRAPFSHTALHTKAALALRRFRIKENTVSALAQHSQGWAYLLMRRHPASSTKIRSNRSR